MRNARVERTGMNKENLARVLKGQDQIQRFRCRVLDWHRWTSWSMIEPDWDRGTMRPTLRCYCADCGRVRFENPYSKTLTRDM